MDNLDALIAEGEAMEASLRKELVAAGFAENELDQMAAELATPHEPTAEDRAAFAKILRTLDSK